MIVFFVSILIIIGIIILCFFLITKDKGIFVPIKQGDFDTVKKMIEADKDCMKQTRRFGMTALKYSIVNSQPKIVNFLIKNGADVNEPGLLKEAIGKQNMDILKMLIENGVNPNDLSALSCSILINYFEGLKFLLSKGAKVSNEFDAAWVALAVHYNSDLKIIKLLIDSGADINLLEDGRTALFYAVNSEKETLVDFLLKNGADPNIRCTKTITRKGDVPLHEASFCEYTNIMKKLITHKAEVNIVGTISGLTPLHEAARWGKKEAVNLLIANGADKNSKGKVGKTPSQWAADNNCYECCSLLD